ncbi:MAG: hypothetical protein K6G18_14380 [Treponema sp.]|nr:hypothetical protein [Treponema sp.]
MSYEANITAIPQLTFTEKLNLLAALVKSLQTERESDALSVLESRAKDIDRGIHCAEHELISA